MPLSFNASATKVATFAMVALVSLSAISPAEAGRRGDYRRHHHNGGKAAAIALGVLTAIAIANAASHARAASRGPCRRLIQWKKRYRVAQAAYRRDLRLRHEYGPAGASDATLQFDRDELRRRGNKVAYWRERCEHGH